jgi:PhnB protein
MHVQSYLFFDGRCEEALAFYKSALSIEIDRVLRFKDSPEPPRPGMHPPGSDDKIMHASFRIGDTLVMASDGNCLGKPAFQGFSLAVSVKTEADADRIFAALGQGGVVRCRWQRRSSRPASAC